MLNFDQSYDKKMSQFTNLVNSFIYFLDVKCSSNRLIFKHYVNGYFTPSCLGRIYGKCKWISRFGFPRIFLIRYLKTFTIE